jgi:hypothetical protein
LKEHFSWHAFLAGRLNFDQRQQTIGSPDCWQPIGNASFTG